MNGKTLFVINPIAGGTDKKPLLAQIKSWVQSSEHEAEMIETTGKNDKDKILSVVNDYKPDTVVAVGGDGTIMLCAGLLKGSDINLGIIPTGSANGMGTELEIPPDADEALEVILHGKVKRIDMLEFNGEHLAMHISDIGLNARVVKQFEESKIRGFLGYARGVIGELMGVKPFEAVIKTEKEEFSRTCYMVAFANAKRYGTGALLNPLGKTDDGLFEVCILKEVNLAGIAGQFFDFIDEDARHLEVIQCKEVEVTTDRAVSFQIDGELQKDTTHLKVSIVPKCLNVLIP